MSVLHKYRTLAYVGLARLLLLAIMRSTHSMRAVAHRIAARCTPCNHIHPAALWRGGYAVHGMRSCIGKRVPAWRPAGKNGSNCIFLAIPSVAICHGHPVRQQDGACIFTQTVKPSSAARISRRMACPLHVSCVAATRCILHTEPVISPLVGRRPRPRPAQPYYAPEV